MTTPFLADGAGMSEAEWKAEIERRDEIIASFKYLTEILREYEHSTLARLGLRISKFIQLWER